MTVSLTPTRRRAARAVAGALGLALLLGACAAATAEQDADAPKARTGAPQRTVEGPGPSDSPDPALAGEPVPTLPPGDPGTGGDGEPTDAAEGDDGHAGEHGPDEAVRARTVPSSALVDAGTVGALAGGSWTEDADAAGPAGCPPVAPKGAAASGTLALRSADGALLQTVSAHRTVRAARRAVQLVADELAACGFTAAGDPRLGEASAALARGDNTGAPEKAVVIATEGATVVLVGRGSAASAGSWDALADMALGTACAAGVHGCH